MIPSPSGWSTATAARAWSFGVTGVPETYLVGSDGTILAKHTGPLTPDAAEDLLKKAR